ncbi:hypothetical protein FACS18949_14540 [Clostridia bacterium]|nr:hypothetical protein FACS189425_10840 [Clostridia bacterium]GHV35827.1 hypothetical protein FACS18949_14540 [Clostridia bacterium]
MNSEPIRDGTRLEFEGAAITVHFAPEPNYDVADKVLKILADVYCDLVCGKEPPTS